MKAYFLPTLLLFFAIQTAFAGALPEAPHIIVTGEYEVRATPDTLTLSLSIAEIGLEVAAARDSVEKRSRELIASLADLNIAKEDIGSAQLQITPHYNWNNSAQIYSGTEVSRQVEVTLRDLSRYDQLIRAIIDARVARIDSTRLSSSNEKELREEALRGAVADGMEKARIMVAHLPVKVGAIYSISPQSANLPMLQGRYLMADSVGTSAFQPGSILFKETLQMVFYLEKD